MRNNKIGTIISYCLICLAIVIVGFRVLGFRSYAVKTASMEPQIPQGSLLYVKTIKPAKVGEVLKVGDDVTFYTSDGLILTHRVISIDLDKKEFTTQGIRDGAMVDSATPFSRIIGKKVFVVSFVGYGIMLFQNPFMIAILVLFIGLIIVISLLLKSVRKSSLTTELKKDNK